MIIKKIQNDPGSLGLFELLYVDQVPTFFLLFHQPRYNGFCVTHILSHVYLKIKNRFFDKHKKFSAVHILGHKAINSMKQYEKCITDPNRKKDANR